MPTQAPVKQPLSFWYRTLRRWAKPLMEVLRTPPFLAGVCRGEYRPAPQGVKMRILRSYLRGRAGVTFVETGSYLGDTISAVKDLCARVVSIEIDPELYEMCRRRFRRCPNVRIILGDCVAVLPQVLDALDGPAAFWLDAHYSGGVTGRGSVDDPVLSSLLQIRAHGVRPCLILADDARCFDGADGRPGLLDVFREMRAIDSRYRIRVHNDIVVAEL